MELLLVMVMDKALEVTDPRTDMEGQVEMDTVPPEPLMVTATLEVQAAAVAPLAARQTVPAQLLALGSLVESDVASTSIPSCSMSKSRSPPSTSITALKGAWPGARKSETI